MGDIQQLTEHLPTISFGLKLTYYLLLGVFALFTAALYYHWTNYATQKSVSRVTLITYMICTLPLLLIMGAIVLIV